MARPHPLKKIFEIAHLAPRIEQRLGSLVFFDPARSALQLVWRLRQFQCQRMVSLQVRRNQIIQSMGHQQTCRNSRSEMGAP